MTDSATSGNAKLDHSIFDADIHGQSANMQYLSRILGWVKPHRKLAITSIILVLFASPWPC